MLSLEASLVKIKFIILYISVTIYWKQNNWAVQQAKIACISINIKQSHQHRLQTTRQTVIKTQYELLWVCIHVHMLEDYLLSMLKSYTEICLCSFKFVDDYNTEKKKKALMHDAFFKCYCYLEQKTLLAPWSHVCDLFFKASNPLVSGCGLWREGNSSSSSESGPMRSYVLI